MKAAITLGKSKREVCRILSRTILLSLSAGEEGWGEGSVESRIQILMGLTKINLEKYMMMKYSMSILNHSLVFEINRLYHFYFSIRYSSCLVLCGLDKKWIKIFYFVFFLSQKPRGSTNRQYNVWQANCQGKHICTAHTTSGMWDFIFYL